MICAAMGVATGSMTVTTASWIRFSIWPRWLNIWARIGFILWGTPSAGNIALRFAGLFPDRINKLAAIEGLGPSPKMLAERNAMTAPERLLKWIGDRKSKSARAPRVMKNYDEALLRMTTAHPHLSPDQLAHLTRTGIVGQ